MKEEIKELVSNFMAERRAFEKRTQELVK